jgi:hypothetical protein
MGTGCALMPRRTLPKAKHQARKQRSHVTSMGHISCSVTLFELYLNIGARLIFLPHFMPLNPSNFKQAEYEVPFVPTKSVKQRETMAMRVVAQSQPNYFARATGLGALAALLGAVIYAVFVGVTGWSIGYLAILVGYMVGKAMIIGSEERGGTEYQVTAVALSYLAVAIAHVMLLWQLANVTSPLILAKYALMFPVVKFATTPGSAMIGLVILFVGMRAAWRMTSGLPGSGRSPFRR